MSPWTGVDLIEAAALAMALFGALLLFAVISRARDDILGSPGGWRLVATALLLFAVRGAVPFLQAPDLAWVQHVAGIVAATVLPIGLFLVLRAGRETEVSPDGG